MSDRRIRAAEIRARRLRNEAPPPVPTDNTAEAAVAEAAGLTSWAQRERLVAVFREQHPEGEPSTETEDFARWLAGPAIRRAVALGLTGREADGFRLLVMRLNFTGPSAEAGAVLEELLADHEAAHFLGRLVNALRSAEGAPPPPPTARRRPATSPIPGAHALTEDVP